MAINSTLPTTSDEFVTTQEDKTSTWTTPERLNVIYNLSISNVLSLTRNNNARKLSGSVGDNSTFDPNVEFENVTNLV
jgi:hypothetical protein